MPLVASNDVSQQTVLEHYLIGTLIIGLRKTLAWNVPEDDFARKLSTLRFVTQCFHRHLGRMTSLEENDGYMDLVEETSPWLGRRVESLRAEHSQLREATYRVVTRLELATDTDWPGFVATCSELADLLVRVERHTQREVALVQEAFDQDTGGEG